MTKYLLMEKKAIEKFDDIKEAQAERDNFELWYPENSYSVVAVDGCRNHTGRVS